MNVKQFTLTLCGLLFAAASFAQGEVEYKLQLMQEELTWGVYLRTSGAEPSGNMFTASGQVTLVLPADFELLDMENYHGLWVANAIVEAPVENPTRRYVSFGYFDSPSEPMDYLEEEMLLFTFKGEVCPDSIYLIDCNTPSETDPFCPGIPDSTPGMNSSNSNPGNDLSALDNVPGGAFYFFTDNYAPSAWSCHDCDGDGTPNALEDTNGNGVYDPDEDVSDLCDGDPVDPCEGITPESATLTGGDDLCAGQSAELFVDITGGTGPFSVVLSDGVQNITIENYSGAAISVTPQVTTQYSLVSVEAGADCEINASGLSGTAEVLVTNALELMSSPTDAHTCEAEEIDFTASVANPDASMTTYVWQRSCDGGGIWEDIDAPSQTEQTVLSTQLSLLAEADMDGCQFRLRAWLDGCGEVISESATLVVSALPDITAQPLAAETCAGESVVFQVETESAADIFWRKSCDGGATWQMILPNDLNHIGMFTNTLTVLSADDDGCLYQAMIDDVSTGNLCGTKFTDPAELSVRQAPQVVNQPASQTICLGETAVFDAAITDVDGLTVQWQQSCDDGATWFDIDPSDAAHSGAQSANLAVESNDDNADCQYRLKATSGDCGEVFSQPALLNAKAPVAFDEMPTDREVCPGETVQFTAEADAFGAIEYQWQMSTDGVDYQDITTSGIGGFDGFDSNVLTVINTEEVAGYSFRLTGNSSICTDRVFSDAAAVSIKETISIITPPEGVNNCEGEAVAFSTNVDLADQSFVQLQWQQLLDGAADWVDLAEGSNYTGVNAEELFIADNTGLHGSRYRLQATGECQTEATQAALLLTEDCSIDSNYLEMKVGLLPDGEGWGVYLRLAEGFEPHDYQTALSGRVILATDAGFSYHSLLSEAAGTWTPGTVVLENWQHPNTRYFTFNLEANNNQLLLQPGNEIMLFRFKPVSGCPKKMYIVEDESELPNTMEMTEFGAVDLDDNYLFFTRVYDYNAWNCHGPAMMANANAATTTSAVSNAMNTSSEDEAQRGIELDYASQKIAVSLSVSPNPATSFADIRISTASENANLYITGMQGQVLERFDLQSGSDFRVDLNHLPTGLYLVVLEEDGAVVQREKLVKK